MPSICWSTRYSRTYTLKFALPKSDLIIPSLIKQLNTTLIVYPPLVHW